MVIDGKKIAEEVLAGLGNTLRGKRLGMVVGSNDVATESFVKIKSRAAERLGVEVLRGELQDLIKTCDGIIVQLPHPRAEEILAVLPGSWMLTLLGRTQSCSHRLLKRYRKSLCAPAFLHEVKTQLL